MAATLSGFGVLDCLIARDVNHRLSVSRTFVDHDDTVRLSWIVLHANGCKTQIMTDVPQREVVTCPVYGAGMIHRVLFAQATTASVSVIHADGKRQRWGNAAWLPGQDVESVLSLLRMVDKEGSSSAP